MEVCWLLALCACGHTQAERLASVWARLDCGNLRCRDAGVSVGGYETLAPDELRQSAAHVDALLHL